MCNILWTVVQNQQIITMKVCVQPQMRVLLPNISKFNWSSLQNTSNLLQNNTLQNISATTYSNISDVVSSSNISNANTYIYSYNMSNSSLNTYAPSVMTPGEESYVPSPGDIQVTPSPTSSTSSTSSTSNFIRGASIGNDTSPMLNITSPSSSVESGNITGMIFVISWSIVILIVLVASFLRIIHKKQVKVRCKQKKLKCTKYTSSVAPDDSIKRPKDYAIEYIENKTKRQLPKREGNETKTPNPPTEVQIPLSGLHTRPLPPLPIPVPPLRTVPERPVPPLRTVPERPVPPLRTVPERPVPPLRTVPRNAKK